MQQLKSITDVEWSNDRTIFILLMFMNKIQFGSQASNPIVYIGHCRVDVNFLIHVNSIPLFIVWV